MENSLSRWSLNIDYMWTYYNEPKQNPAYAINIFLNKYYKSLKILDMGQQVIVKKLYE